MITKYPRDYLDQELAWERRWVAMGKIPVVSFEDGARRAIGRALLDGMREGSLKSYRVRVNSFKERIDFQRELLELPEFKRALELEHTLIESWKNMVETNPM